MLCQVSYTTLRNVSIAKHIQLLTAEGNQVPDTAERVSHSLLWARLQLIEIRPEFERGEDDARPGGEEAVHESEGWDDWGGRHT